MTLFSLFQRQSILEKCQFLRSLKRLKLSQTDGKTITKWQSLILIKLIEEKKRGKKERQKDNPFCLQVWTPCCVLKDKQQKANAKAYSTPNPFNKYMSTIIPITSTTHHFLREFQIDCLTTHFRTLLIAFVTFCTKISLTNSYSTLLMVWDADLLLFCLCVTFRPKFPSFDHWDTRLRFCLLLVASLLIWKMLVKSNNYFSFHYRIEEKRRDWSFFLSFFLYFCFT